ncbi:hypothetical protein GQ600_12262 [Phytophthora cactorum]|nr:hypothetical protein GQ600_12262 [Phytophthora cactorum]
METMHEILDRVHQTGLFRCTHLHDGVDVLGFIRTLDSAAQQQFRQLGDLVHIVLLGDQQRVHQLVSVADLPQFVRLLLQDAHVVHDLGEEDAVAQIFHARDLHVRRQLLMEALHLGATGRWKQRSRGVELMQNGTYHSRRLRCAVSSMTSYAKCESEREQRRQRRCTCLVSLRVLYEGELLEPYVLMIMNIILVVLRSRCTDSPIGSPWCALLNVYAYKFQMNGLINLSFRIGDSWLTTPRRGYVQTGYRKCSCWKIHSLSHTYVCDDIEWSCTRLFYRSYHLPCRHIMHLADVGTILTCFRSWLFMTGGLRTLRYVRKVI